MLGQHSSIFSGLETYWFDLNWKNKTNVISRARRRILEMLEDQLDILEYYFSLSPEISTQLKARAHSPESYLGMLMAYCSKRAGKPRWLEKTPGNILHLPRILSHWPEAQCIHIIRSPLDVFASNKKGPTPRRHPDHFIETWIEFMKEIETVKNQGILTPANFMTVSYKRLVTDTVAVIREVLDFLNEPFESAAAEFHGNKHDFEAVLAKTGQQNTTLKRMCTPLSTSRLGIWKQIVTKEEIEYFEARIEEASLSDVWREQVSQEGAD